MRWYVSIGAVLVAGVLAGGDVAGVAAPNPRDRHQPASATGRQGSQPTVDVELVLAVDVSYSMDMDELAIQREGYAQAIVSKEFLQALKTGPNGKISVTYFEWAASTDQKIIIPWRVIDGPGDRRRRRQRDHEDADPPRLAHLDLGRDQFRHAAVRREPASRPAARDRYFRRRPQQQRRAGHDRARCGAGEGHHHQRPADHGEGAVLLHDGYRQSRSSITRTA